jgi:hypothetical protein
MVSLVYQAHRAIAFEILPIKYSVSAAGGEANEDHLLIFRHKKTENSRFFSQQAAELAKDFCQRHSEIT